MKLPRRKFLHLVAGAAALPALPRIARAQANNLRTGAPAFLCAMTAYCRMGTQRLAPRKRQRNLRFSESATGSASRCSVPNEPQPRRHKTMPVARTISSISNFGPIATRLTGQFTAAPNLAFQSSNDSI
jgi:hypothetical protein